VGNVSAALIAMGFGALTAAGSLPGSAWRWMFAVGILPALLAVVVMSRLKEPERWTKAVAEGVGRKKAGSLVEMFGTPKWRHRAIVGMILASSGVIGLWAIGFFSIDLNRSVFRKSEEQKARDAGGAELDRQFVRLAIRSPGELDELVEVVQSQNLLSADPKHKDAQFLYAAALELHRAGRKVSAETVLETLDRPAEGRPAQSDEDRRRRAEFLAGGNPATSSAAECARSIEARRKYVEGQVGWWGSITSMLFNIGAFFGIYAFSRITQQAGRKPTFALFFVAALVSTAVAFWFMDTELDVFWMVPLMGFCQLSLFGGYAIYFPELFPTRLRSTGTSLCYNIARYAAASGPAVLGLLTGAVFTPARGFEEPLRYAGLTMCAVFLIGLVVLPFAPETKDQPLPE